MKTCKAAVWLVIGAVLFGGDRVATAQTPLDRLDRQIRERAGTPQPEVAPPRDVPQPPQPGASAPATTEQPDDAKAAYLGVTVTDRDSRGRGVEVVEVSPGSPANKAGIRRGDLIVSVGGVRIRQDDDLIETVKVFSPGSRVDIAVLRDGQAPTRVSATLASQLAASESPAKVAPPAPRASEPARPRALSGTADYIPPAAQPYVPTIRGRVPRQTPIEMLEQRVDQLERRVAELERRLAEKTTKEPSP